MATAFGALSSIWRVWRFFRGTLKEGYSKIATNQGLISCKGDLQEKARHIENLGDSLDWLLVTHYLFPQSIVNSLVGCLLYMQNFRSPFRPDAEAASISHAIHIHIIVWDATFRLELPVETTDKIFLNQSLVQLQTHESHFAWRPRGTGCWFLAGWMDCIGHLRCVWSCFAVGFQTLLWERELWHTPFILFSCFSVAEKYCGHSLGDLSVTQIIVITNIRKGVSF